MPTRNAFQELWVAKAAAKHRGEGRHRPIHQADEAGLDDLKHESLAGVAILFALDFAGKPLGLDLGGGLIVPQLGFGEVAEQLTDGGIRRAACGL